MSFELSGLPEVDQQELDLACTVAVHLAAGAAQTLDLECPDGDEVLFLELTVYWSLEELDLPPMHDAQVRLRYLQTGPWGADRALRIDRDGQHVLSGLAANSLILSFGDGSSVFPVSVGAAEGLCAPSQDSCGTSENIGMLVAERPAQPPHTHARLDLDRPLDVWIGWAQTYTEQTCGDDPFAIYELLMANL